MENNQSIIKEVNKVIKEKLTACNCNPCTCSNQKKENYFKEIKNILTTFNKSRILNNGY